MIQIDLRNLTEEKIAEAMPRRGGCQYRNPCLIGTLMTEDQRYQMDNQPDGKVSVRELCEKGLIKFPNGQEDLAHRLQLAFDRSDFDSTRLEPVLDEVRSLRDGN